MVQIEDMVAFVTVVELASFTEGAKRLATTKSVVSRRISDLEHELGATLLDRSARGARPTEVGAVYYAKCVRILESIHAASDFVAGFNNLVKGKLRVAVPRSFDGELIVPLLNRFALEYPDVLLDIEAGSGIHPMEQHFDVAIRVGELDDSELIARGLAAYRYLLCASPDYLERRGAPTLPEDLQEHDALVDGSGEHGGVWRYRTEGEWRSFRFRERLRSSSCRQLIEAARAGLGIAMLPRPLVANDIAAGRLQVLLADHETPTGQLSLVYPKSRRSSQKVQKLLGFLTQSVSSAFGSAEPPSA